MSISLTSEQVRGLAPDESSLKAARGLASPRPWSNLGHDTRAIWGACQGSGKDPYLTQVDWAPTDQGGPAFKCSCPSRKFPCKHGLALLLLLAEQPGGFSANQPQPDWVSNWINSRQKRAEAKAEPKPEAIVDEAARAARAEKRTARIVDGIDLLELWLRDLVQQGLTTAPGKGFGFWDEQAARLVDAQAPGLARRVRELGDLAVSGEGWQDRLLNAIGRLVLLIHGFRRIDQMPAETQADLRAAIGLAAAQADILNTEPAVRDNWFVAGQSVELEDRLRVQRTWLLGEHTGQAALILDFAHGTTGFKNSLLPATSIEAELAFFPSATPQRALLKQALGSPQPASNGILSAMAIADAYTQVGQRIAANPWIENHPIALQSVVIAPSGKHWLIVDEEGAAMHCAHRSDALLAVSAGNPIDLFGEWDGVSFNPLLVYTPVDRRYTAIRKPVHV